MKKNKAKPAHHSGRRTPQIAAITKNVQFLQNASSVSKNTVKLTISLLVSNRINTVRKCFNSLRPLLDALPSELIVVDTVGPENSDGSLAVAREYADRIVRFEWCDDFAAARNAGLMLAKGEWFLYIDDDEWFEDVSAIIDFLKTDNLRYDVCQYRVRNYTDRIGQNFVDTYAERLVRRNAQLHFEDRIHEQLVGKTPHVKILDTFVHHYGYAFDNREDFEKHSLRNVRSLEKLLKEQPDSLRAIMHLAQEYILRQEYPKADRLCHETLERTSYPDVNNYISMLAFYYIRVLFNGKKWEEIRKQSDQLLNRSDVSELAKAGICIIRNECAHVIFDFENTLLNVDGYLRWLDVLNENPDKLAAQQMSYLGTSILEPSCASILENGLRTAAAMGDRTHIKAFTQRVAANPGESHLILEKCLPLMIRFAADEDSFVEMYSLIEPHLKKDSSLSCFLACAQSYLEPIIVTKNQLRLAEYLTGLPIDRPYVVLLKMRAAEKAQDSKGLAELFDHYLDLEGVGFVQEFIQIACRNGLDLTKCAGKINIGQWDGGMRKLVDSCSLDQAHAVLQYLKGYFTEDSLEVRSLENALGLKALKEDAQQSDTAGVQGFHSYIERLYAYHLALSNPENFTEARCNYLEVGAQVAFFLKQSIDFGNAGDLASQLRMLRKALYLKSDLAGIVEMVMKNLEKQIEQKKAASIARANAEFKALAARLKSAVSEFIRKGDMQNARNILDQMNQLLPGDPDLPELYMLLKQ